MPLKIEYTTQFKRDLKLSKKRAKSLPKLKKIMDALIAEEQLPLSCKNHRLSGNWVHHLECHIEPDWLLIYRYSKNLDTIVFVRTGTHSDLFD